MAVTSGQTVVQYGLVTTSGFVVTGGAAQVIVPGASNARSYLRIVNMSTTGTLWLTKGSAAPVANTPGSYPLLPGNVEEFGMLNFIPLNQIQAISDGSTINVTVEYFQT